MTLEQLEAQCDAQSAKWRELHKDDPCAYCGASDDVSIKPIGSIAKLTPLCRQCGELLEAKTQAWRDGYAAGFEAGKRQRPWWL